MGRHLGPKVTPDDVRLRQGVLEFSFVFPVGDFDAAETLEMRRDELRVEELITLRFEMGDEMSEADL